MLESDFAMSVGNFESNKSTVHHQQPKHKLLNLTQEQIQNEIGRLKLVEKSSAKVVTYAPPSQTSITITKKLNTSNKDETSKNALKEETNNYASSAKARPKSQILKSNWKPINIFENFDENQDTKPSNHNKNSNLIINNLKVNRLSIVDQRDGSNFKGPNTSDNIKNE
jgi:hypothetical protein